MSKYIEIKNCTNCIYCKYYIRESNSSYYWCTNQILEIPNIYIENNVFPEFCKFPDLEKING